MAQDSKVYSAFSEGHVAQLTGLSKWQLRAWDKAGFFRPRYAYEDRSAPYSRVYSFTDLVGLRTVAVLRKQYHVSMNELRRVAEELMRRGFSNWAEIKLHVVKGQVHFVDPGTRNVEGVWDGQYAMLPIVEVIDGLERDVARIRRRDPRLVGRVEQHKFVMRNAEVVAGTRIPAGAIRRYHEAGYTTAQILAEYPTLTRRDVEAALEVEPQQARSA